MDEGGRPTQFQLTGEPVIGKMRKMLPMDGKMAQTEIARLLESVAMDRGELAVRLGCHLSTLYPWERGDSRPNLATIETLRRLCDTGPSLRKPSRPIFRFIDLFAGIGGLRLGVESARGKCVFTCEWDNYCRRTYEANFHDSPEHPFADDINVVNPEDIPRHDLLVAGFPCQPFSIAGVSKKNALGRPHGFECREQGHLFFKIAAILNAHRPAGFLLENVKNLKSHDRGRTFKIILQVLQEELGYKVQYRIINAAGFVPQHRERLFIVGFRQEVGFDFNALQIPDADHGPKLRSILHPEDGSEQEEPPYTSGPQATVNSKYILTSHLWNYLRRYAAKHRALGNGFGYGLVGPNDISRTLSARYFKDGSEILVDRGKNQRPRRLTPRECAKLMGFDSAERPKFEIPVSDTRAYKQFGNAVVVPVVEAVAKSITPFLLKAVGGSQLELRLETAGMTS
jgi:DNA (cytosine-5)-methyltransferase 1